MAKICCGNRREGHSEFKIKTSRACDYYIPNTSGYPNPCGRPAGWAWHESRGPDGDYEEVFCHVHRTGQPADDSEEAYNEFWSTA